VQPETKKTSPVAVESAVAELGPPGLTSGELALIRKASRA
jgi:hypothetical protein